MGKNKVLKVIGIVGLVFGVYFGVIYAKRKFRGLPIKGSDLAGGNITIEQTDEEIYVVDTSTEDLFYSYKFTGMDMDFPLSNDPSTAYDNVAKLQAFLLFANPTLEMPIDGLFGDLTSQAVLDETEGLTDYGYDSPDYDYETITQSYYNEVVIPELQYFINNQ